MSRFLSVCVFACLFLNVVGLGNVIMDCPGNQVLVSNIRSTRMPSCARHIIESGERNSGSEEMSEEYEPNFHELSANLPFACRCPGELMLDLEGTNCITADECAEDSEEVDSIFDPEHIESSRVCPANQQYNTWSFGFINSCYAYPRYYDDALMNVECGCEHSEILGMDGQTCVLRESCPPMCHGNQTLNLLSGRDCTPTCDDPEPECGSQPISRCECPETAPILASDGLTCITIAQCPTRFKRESPVIIEPTEIPTECPPNQVPMLLPTTSFSWLTGNERVDACRDICWPISSGMLHDRCDGAMELGCGCREGHKWTHSGECVRQEACPQECFGSNQEWNTCGSTCIQTCENQELECDSSICVPRCQCPPERPFLWNETHCVTTEGCTNGPEVEECEGGKVYVECSDCPLTCSYRDIVCALESCTPGCVCPMEAQYLLEDGSCATREECFPSVCVGDEIAVECAGCPMMCRGPQIYCDAIGCFPGCGCPEDKPYSLGDGRCATREQCADCPGDETWTDCLGCPMSCDAIGMVCMMAEQCTPGCACPQERPYSNGEGVCSTLEECQACMGDLVFNNCGLSCDRTCSDPDPMCNMMCTQRCECPADQPILMSDGSCGSREACEGEPDDFALNYDNRRSFRFKLDRFSFAKSLKAIDGHSNGPLTVKMRDSSVAKATLTIRDVDNNVVTMGGLCINSKHVKKIKVKYYGIDGEVLGSNTERANNKWSYFGDVIPNVAKVRIWIEKKSGKSRIEVGNMRMPVGEEDCTIE